MNFIKYYDRNVLRYELTHNILNNPKEILKYLQIGINIPIWSEFDKYILNDLEYYQAKSFLLYEDGNLIGNSLIFDDGHETLYFGYFGVINNETDKILFLIDLIIDYARDNNFKFILGPINIPVIIYGWGFMKAGSLNNLYACKPVNPPIYQKLFLKKGFSIKHEDITWEGSPLPRINPWKMKQYDFSDYEYFNPNDFNEFLKLKPDFLRLHTENLPPSSRITPDVAGVVDNYIRYIFEYGHNCMLFFVRYIPTEEIIACGSYLPNPFRKDTKGNYDSCVIYTWVVDPKHRRKGITMLMYGATSLQLFKKKVIYGSGPIPSDNIANTEVANVIGGAKGRTHLVLEFKT